MYSSSHFLLPTLVTSYVGNWLSGMGLNASIFMLLIGEFLSLEKDERGSVIHRNQSVIRQSGPFTSIQTLLQLWSEDNTILDLSRFLPKLELNEGRRLPFMMPVMYNLGVITTLLVILTVLMFKGLTLGIIILILNLQGKLKAQQTNSGRPIHIHVHGGTKRPYSYPYYYDPWDRLEEEPVNSTMEPFQLRGFRK